MLLWNPNTPRSNRSLKLFSFRSGYRLILLLALAACLSGCTSQEYYPPVVDASQSKPYGVSPAPKTPDPCEQHEVQSLQKLYPDSDPLAATRPAEVSPQQFAEPTPPRYTQPQAAAVPPGGSYALGASSLYAASPAPAYQPAVAAYPATPPAPSAYVNPPVAGPTVSSVSVTDEYGQTYFPQSAQPVASVSPSFPAPEQPAPSFTAQPVTPVAAPPAPVPAESPIPAQASLPPQPQPQPQPDYSPHTTLKDLETYVNENPQDRQAQIALQLLYSVYRQDDENPQPLNVSPQEAADVTALSRTITFLNDIEKGNAAADSAKAAAALNALEELQQKLSVHAEPVITTIVLCSRVDGFGRYQAIPQADLQSGRAQRVLVYCELKNVRSQKNENGQYLTRLRAHIAFYDADYNIIGTPRNEDVIDTPSFNPRQDFFLRGDYELPNLTPGKYQVVVRIEDLIADKIARDARYDFEVTAGM